ncbi:isoaspartyl peptidase/L-asparaginase [Duganella aceris]|uniref:L-asparaginase n=1 Tax=Duganella aceris TaxID=2703883 RepID=A0ABX0FNP9_9BURK|nr:isoaspartyl peptidase/L-asparaginase [Duganella aceris]NGZ86245.1 L-asparaginase [Duganella aceris]
MALQTPFQPCVLVHGGAGSPLAYRDGCIAAAEQGLNALRAGGDALAAAVAAVVMLEDDPRFNAGTGSALRMDGRTIEMDAAVMDSLGALGAVACLQRVRNPVLVAKAVTHTPHWLLCGSGAQRFAHDIGAAEHDVATPQARARHEEMLQQLRHGEPVRHGSDNADFLDYWNFAMPPPSLHDAAAVAGAAATDGSGQGGTAPPTRRDAACDTVGAVVRDGAGHFAVAGSTGGATPSLLGRVGDTPIIGAGFYAGPQAAIAVTGIGEQIVRHLLARTVYDWLAGGMPLALALERAVALFDPAVAIGVIAVSRDDSGSRSNNPMPTALACYAE